MNVTSNKRLLALDVMRGITIAGMILVNTPGSWQHTYAPLKHAEWIGLYFPSSCLSWGFRRTSLYGSMILPSVYLPV